MYDRCVWVTFSKIFTVIVTAYLSCDGDYHHNYYYNYYCYLDYYSVSCPSYFEYFSNISLQYDDISLWPVTARLFLLNNTALSSLEAVIYADIPLIGTVYIVPGHNVLMFPPLNASYGESYIYFLLLFLLFSRPLIHFFSFLFFRFHFFSFFLFYFFSSLPSFSRCPSESIRCRGCRPEDPEIQFFEMRQH